MIRRRIVPVVLSFLMLSSCTSSETPSAPDRSTSRDLSSGIITPATSGTRALVAPLNRETPLPADVSWSFAAGPDGVVSTNASLGLTISIPAGALASTQLITVTAPAGSAIAYQFLPHQTFAVPVSLTQSLRGTTGGLTSLLLSAGHLPDETLSLSFAGLAEVDETVPVVVDLLAGTAQFNVGHFSGWIIATGRDDGSDSTDASGFSGQ